MSLKRAIGAMLVGGLISTPALADDHGADDSRKFTAERVFDIEYASDPQISPNGETIVYVRRSMDKLTDRDRGDLWTIDVKSGAHRPLITGGASAGAPRWSPDGTKLIYTTATDGKPDLRLYYFDSDRSVSLGQFSAGPGNAAWSPDGSTIAFTMFTPGQTPSFAKPPAAPEGATWSEPVRVFDDLQFRFDGAGYLEEGATHVYTLPASGGTPRQITSGEADFGSPTWLGDDTLLVVGNEAEDRDLDPIESEIYAVNLADLSRTALTTRDGPDLAPSVSPDASKVAYLGYDDLIKSYQQADLYVMNADGSEVVELAADFDRGFSSVTWHPNGRSLIAQIENAGVIDVISVSMEGEVETLVTNVGGTSIGRPYAAGSFTVSDTRRPVMAYTAGSPDRPAEIAVTGSRIDDRILTDLNSDVLDHLDMATIEEINVPSRHDGLEIEAWVALPPGFEADGSAPMLMEIHGGPFAMYGPYFASEIQRFAAEGYVTVYVNPRGSTGYGSDFALAIDLAYPGYDYEDLMSVTDALIERNYVSADRLFVTGGSGGGILTAWIVGKTDRFAAAATVKPVINWMTMALSADIAQFVRRHWIRSDPWENPEAFLDRSPIMLIEDVVTPTLVMVGEEDWRTPTWEAEQFYTALKLNGVDTALIRVPGSPHYIAGRPSRLIAKTDNIMGWFAKYDPAKQESED
ncbi:MAG: S9 family peptidase [Pseudomonadota bacterium]